MPSIRTPRTGRRRVVALAGLALAAAVVPVAGVAGVAGAAGSKTVTLKDIAFAPKRLTVGKGTKVTFAFRDGTTTHNVTSKGSPRFKTIGNRSSGAPARTFSTAGTYRYHCTLHPGMTGRIVVR